jgi:hypothetical protein
MIYWHKPLVWLSILSLLAVSGSTFATEKIKSDENVDKPGKAEEVVKGKALVQTIKLEEYLKNLKDDEVVEKMDSQNKNKPDIFIVFKKNEDGTRQLVMQLFDINRDGKIDLVKHFEKGKLVKTEIDLDYDGYVDVVSEYDPVTGDLKKKIQADGSTNIWKYYFKNELRKKEVDRNSDGKPDMWVYYRNGKVIRTEVDKDFTGKIVRIDGPLNPVKDKKSKAALQ